MHYLRIYGLVWKNLIILPWFSQKILAAYFAALFIFLKNLDSLLYEDAHTARVTFSPISSNFPLFIYTDLCFFLCFCRSRPFLSWKSILIFPMLMWKLMLLSIHRRVKYALFLGNNDLFWWWPMFILAGF